MRAYANQPLPPPFFFPLNQGAMAIVGFNQDMISTVFRLIAAILHLGNLTFEATGDDSCIVSSKETLEITSELLRVSPENLEETFTFLLVKTGRDSIKKSIPVSKVKRF